MPIPGPLELLLILTICIGPITILGIVIFFVLRYHKRVEKLEERVDSIRQEFDQNKGQNN